MDADNRRKSGSQRPGSASVWQHKTGELPTYLINRKKEANQEQLDMLS